MINLTETSLNYHSHPNGNYRTEFRHHQTHNELIESSRSTSEMLFSNGSSDITTKDLVRIDGFNIICSFHQFMGLPYYGMTPSSCNIFRNLMGVIFSLLFITIFIISLVPCMLICTNEDKAGRFKSERINKSRSAEIVALMLLCLEAYHTIDNDFGLLIFARKEFPKFYKELEKIVLNHHLFLSVKHRRKLLFTAWVLIILNIGHAVVECIFLYPIINQDILEQTNPDESYIKLPKTFSLYLTLIIKAIGSIHSKALDTIIVYISLLIACYIRTFGKKLNILCEETIKSNVIRSHRKSRESFDEMRIAFISLQNLITEADNMLSPCILMTVGSNTIAILGGIFVGIDVFGHKAELEEEEAFDLFNCVSCFIALFATGIFADSLVVEAQQSLRSLEKLRFTKISENDFKSVKTMIESIEESKLRSLSGSGFFTLNKKFLYGIWGIIFPYTVILVQKY